MNNPEYCQGIYEAAKKVSEIHSLQKQQYAKGLGLFLNNIALDLAMDSLKRALEGKGT